ncbi:Na(+)/H(+) antiporter subunit F1 [Lysinibacillus yapensis]|uniref:Na(+)/H(+) antiporter subunit F1 n=1 Tax=Ureibacillus yapensis TaxID=2304605 RepID=A0A396SF09_9BACL|nr:Na(+)/H(+) antiporter subunit F1 [Lysinibacillus yapensis]RHW36822.1 Na(+)/H(+) antiporter subunit F1 [Lysinibacillus yapensis]
MTYFLWAAIVIVVLTMVALLYRIVKGPTPSDRVVALDTIGVALICLVGLLSVVVDSSFFLEIILLLAILSFVGTIAFSKFIEKGDIITRDDSR